jgi:hypothetical protein
MVNGSGALWAIFLDAYGGGMKPCRKSLFFAEGVMNLSVGRKFHL